MLKIFNGVINYQLIFIWSRIFGLILFGSVNTFAKTIIPQNGIDKIEKNRAKRKRKPIIRMNLYSNTNNYSW